ncbi:hypothetical protein [Cohnella faecalis]|uniref:Uncharacterized protein n=1 Tax=Cohnella faecalis TaxID=2315694 RepID=A0A398CUW8_9BACL|nr:hypothetical protein [Cohnella faecalis]RIE05059.1 hypothetical protein D3H35_02710 [Cohnella faecalis]
MKKMVSFMLVSALLLSFSGMVFATQETKNNGILTSDVDLTKERTEKNKIKINNIKKDPDFEIVYDDGQGNASFVPSNAAQGKSDKQRIKAKLESFSTQYSYSTVNSGLKNLSYSDGQVTSQFYSDINNSNGEH